MTTALKALEGTEKQIAWAEQIRLRIITEAQYVIDAPAWVIEPSFKAYRAVAEEAFAHLCRQGKAIWWIEHREKNGASLITYFAAKYRDKMKAEGKGEMFQHPNQFMRPKDRLPLPVNGATIY